MTFLLFRSSNAAVGAVERNHGRGLFTTLDPRTEPFSTPGLIPSSLRGHYDDRRFVVCWGCLPVPVHPRAGS